MFVVESACGKALKRGPHLPKATTAPTPLDFSSIFQAFFYTRVHSETSSEKYLVISRALES